MRHFLSLPHRRRKSHRALVAAERLEQRLVLSPITGSLNTGGPGNVSISQDDDGNVTIRGTSGNESLEVEVVDSPNSAPMIHFRPLDSNTTVEGSAAGIYAFASEYAVGDWDIDLGGSSDFVCLRNVTIGGDLQVEGTTLDLERVFVDGETELHLESWRITPTTAQQWGLDTTTVHQIVDSQFTGEFELSARGAVDLTVDAIFLDDAKIETWGHGVNRLDLDVWAQRDFRLDTDDGDAEIASVSQYELRLHDSLVNGHAEIKTGESDGLSGSVHIEESEFRDRLKLTIADDLGELHLEEAMITDEAEFDAKGGIASIRFDDMEFGHDVKVEVDGDVGLMSVQRSAFGTVRHTAPFRKRVVARFSIDVNGDQHQIDELLVDKSEFSSHVDWRIRDNGGGPTDPSQSAPVVRVTNSEFHSTTSTLECVGAVCSASNFRGRDFRLSTSDDHDDDVYFTGVAFSPGWDIEVKLHGGADTVYLQDVDMSEFLDQAAKMTLDGGPADGDDERDGWYDRGGNIFGEPIREKSIDELVITQTATAGGLQAVQLDLEGPRVQDHTAARDRFRVTFNEPIDLSTLTTADVSVTRQDGTIIPVAGISPLSASQRRTFDVLFQSPATAGYRIVIGPDVEDWQDNRMNQDGDATNGEAGDDGFLWEDFEGPRVTHSSARVIANDPADVRQPSKLVQVIRVKFDQFVEPSSFTPKEVNLTDFTGRALLVTDVRPVEWSSGRQFDIVVADFGPGGYHLTIGSKVTDFLGNRMDQDGDGTNGEARQDQYSIHHKDNTGPVLRIVESRPWRGFTVAADEPLDPVSFTPERVRIVEKATGKSVRVDAVEMLAFSGGTHFDVRFQADPGEYEVTILPKVEDLFENRMAAGWQTTLRIDLVAPGNGQLTPLELQLLASLRSGGPLSLLASAGPLTTSDVLDAIQQHILLNAGEDVWEGLINPSPADDSTDVANTTTGLSDELLTGDFEAVMEAGSSNPSAATLTSIVQSFFEGEDDMTGQVSA